VTKNYGEVSLTFHDRKLRQLSKKCWFIWIACLCICWR